MPLAGQHLQRRIRVRLRRTAGIVNRHQLIPVAMKDQHVSRIALRRIDGIKIINAGKIVAPNVHQHMEILFGDFVHTSKELSCVVRQRERRRGQRHRAHPIGMRRGSQGGNHAALTVSKQEDVLFVHVAPRAKHGDFRFQILLFRENGHIQRTAVALAAGAAAAKIKANGEIALTGQRLRVSLSAAIGVSVAVGENHGRINTRAAFGNVKYRVKSSVFRIQFHCFCVV